MSSVCCWQPYFLAALRLLLHRHEIAPPSREHAAPESQANGRAYQREMITYIASASCCLTPSPPYTSAKDLNAIVYPSALNPRHPERPRHHPGSSRMEEQVMDVVDTSGTSMLFCVLEQSRVLAFLHKLGIPRTCHC